MPRLLPARLLAALRPDATARLELPGDLLRDSRRRVWTAGVLGVAAYTAFLLFELSRVPGGPDFEHSIDVTHDLLGIALCTALVLVAAAPRLGDRSVLRIALVVQVLLSILISLAVPWAAFVRAAHVPTLTWVVPVIILFPLLVPAPPPTALMVSILCAAAMPGGLALLAARGLIEPRPSDLWASALTSAVAVGIAAVASRTVHGAGRQVAAARAVGSYELIEPLGHGGMGEVWKARHSFLARPAAVKLIRPETLQGPREARDEAIQRFTREAQVTASLRSPHTVELFDFGVSADGTLYYAMELLEGINVEHFVYRFGPIEPRRAVHWLQQACHSLGEAHARDLVHRDIKPANLYLCRYGRDLDFVKVLDFGLTKPAATREDGALTDPGIRLGTPSYMAPEQIFGMPTDGRTDLYALGCVAYWLLAGEKPFEAESPAELMRRHAQEPPPPLSRKVRVPERLEASIMRCLSKDPRDRPADADRLSNELGDCLEERWTEADARQWWAENFVS